MRSQCELLGPVGVSVQAVEAAFIVCMLLWKRSRERPMRPLGRWAWDVALQGLASVGVHFANVVWSDGGGRSQCQFYLANLVLDTTLGTLLVSLVVAAMGALGSLRAGGELAPRCKAQGGAPTNFTGENSTTMQPTPPTRPTEFLWPLQFLLGVALAKGAVFLLLGKWAGLPEILRRLLENLAGGDKNVQVALVLLVAPLVFNCFQYYVLDTLIAGLDAHTEDTPLLASAHTGRAC